MTTLMINQRRKLILAKASSHICLTSAEPVINHQNLMKEQDQRLENEVNADLEFIRNQDNFHEMNGDARYIDSAQEDSEFVDATQTQLVNVPNEDIEEGEVNADGRNDIPTRIQQDMEFLKQSWENIAEDEDAEARLLVELNQEHDGDMQQHGIDTDGFQLVASKQQKKEQRKLQNLNRGVYQTRSRKVVHSKPFK